MKLIKYRVRKFRSVQDSGWLTLDRVNALMGENESGKTNLLLPLWKLKPSFGGEIDLASDAPRGEYSEIRKLEPKERPVFITAIFELSSDERTTIASIAECPSDWVAKVKISRKYDGKYLISFPEEDPTRSVNRTEILEPLSRFLHSLDQLEPNKTDTRPREVFLSVLSPLIRDIESGEDKVTSPDVQRIREVVENLDVNNVSKTGGILELHETCLDALGLIIEQVSVDVPTQNKEARLEALALLPNFIYYSNYGNLDGSIYLPRVIADMKREDLSEREEAKARTLKVLFEYVQLDPAEIQSMGKELPPNANQDQIDAKTDEIRERTILLTSAASAMTRKFAEWWRQGEYVFEFKADGDHFRIWVSDKLRPDPIELENRSTGLQWFFSFFLVFLNERNDTHFGSILLLDEPGITLHPIAQKDLFLFFEGLSQDNQIIYTTHSPFLMDPDKLDQVKAVFVDEHGHSCASDDLRSRARIDNSSEQKAVYPVHSALGLTVSEVLFTGCSVLLVEGPSDQYYLSGIKTLLIAKGLLNPSRELLFVPAGGARGIKSTAQILSYDENDYPHVLMDSDNQGRSTKSALLSNLYSGRESHVHEVGDYIPIENAEVEDFTDTTLVARVASRMFRGGEDDFEDVFDPVKPVVPQIVNYCKSEKIELVQGWKVDLARQVKRRMLKSAYSDAIDDSLLHRWQSLFDSWLNTE